MIWSLFFLRPSSRLIPVSQRWLASAAVAAAAVVVTVAGAVVVVAVVAAVASLLPMRHPLDPTAAGKHAIDVWSGL